MRMDIKMPATQATSRARTELPSKKTANLSLSTDVLQAARRLGSNTSQVCDKHLRELAQPEHARRWREDHADFIAAYNASVETEGLPLVEWRNF